MKIADLFAEVGFKFDSIKLKEVGKILGDLNVSSVVGVTSLTSLGLKIKDLIEQAGQASKELTTLSKSTGIEPTFIDKFGKFSKAMGASKEEANSFLATLSKIQFNIKMGKGGESPFILANLDPYKETSELVGDIVKKFSELSKLQGDPKAVQQRAQLISYLSQELGASSDMLKVLTAGEEKFADMENFISLTSKQIDASTKATYEWVKATESLNTALQITATELLPGLTSALKSFTEEGGLKTIVDMLGSIGRTFERFGIIGQYAKVAGMNTADFLNKSYVNTVKLGQKIRGERVAGSNSQVNHFSVTVHASDVKDFVHKFDIEMRKKLMNADLQFGQHT